MIAKMMKQSGATVDIELNPNTPQNIERFTVDLL